MNLPRIGDTMGIKPSMSMMGYDLIGIFMGYWVVCYLTWYNMVLLAHLVSNDFDFERTL
jgi:hypothetical protein